MPKKLDKVAVHRIREQVTTDEIVKKFKENPGFPNVGSCIIFNAFVKGVNREGKPQSALEMEPADHTLKEMKAIAAEIEKKPGVLDVQIHLNTGILNSGDTLLQIAIDTTVDGPQIGEIFQALKDTLDSVKKRAGIKLKEKSIEGWYYTKPKEKAKSFD